MENVKIPNCRQEECPVRESGKCLEGLNTQNCSHFYFVDANEEDLLDESQGEANKSEKFRLYSGQDLSIEELKLITYKHRSNIITIIGESESGKTTLLSSIFDLFQIGKFSQFYFAGSLTSIGFERRCHLSRESSKANVPETEKTNSQEFKYLHLAVKRKNSLTDPAYNLLISDISGERFRNATSSSSFMRDLDIIKHSEHIVFLLDGEKLSDKFNRTAVIANFHQFVRRAIDVGIFNHKTDITIAVSKFDILVSDTTFKFLELIEEPFLRKFSAELQNVEFVKFAARPKVISDAINFGYGLEVLLHHWVKSKISLVDANKEEVTTFARSFENYQFLYD